MTAPRTGPCLVIASLALLAACSESTPPASAVIAALPTELRTTRDGSLAAEVPRDLVVSVLERALLATSPDGSFRLFLEHRPGETLTAVLGAIKDELIGLGWEPVEEQHFENAILVHMARGPKQQRLQRETWIVEGGGEVALCEAIAAEIQVARLGAPLRQLCQTLRLTPRPPPG